jgi:ribonuclease HII
MVPHRMAKQPDFSYESHFWNRGISVVAGADEVGRGAFAGPVVTAVVAFAPDTKIEIEIADSKILSPAKRERASLWIKSNALSWAIGEGSVAEINRLGIVGATNRAFRRAVAGCKLSIENLLIDAFYIPYVGGLPKRRQTPIIKGDSKSLSIASASIIAKVYRDELMVNLSKAEKYGCYCWHSNKGYGTLAHRQALAAHGPTCHHRKLFIL